MPEDNISHIDFTDLNRKAISKPLVEHIYTADPSAHVFEGKIYIYPSHDIESDILSMTWESFCHGRLPCAINGSN